MNNKDLIPIDSVFTVDSSLDLPEFVTAKKLMNNNYGNEYVLLPPHITYALTPLPESNFEKVKVDIISYINRQKPFKAHISDLVCEAKKDFFYVSIIAEQIKQHHKNITRILNRYRDNSIRTKDLVKLNNGEFDSLSAKYVKEFGYSRVFERYVSHATIGNFTKANVDVSDLTGQLRLILKTVLNTEISIDGMHCAFSNSTTQLQQSNADPHWEQTFELLGGDSLKPS